MHIAPVFFETKLVALLGSALRRSRRLVAQKLNRLLQLRVFRSWLGRHRLKGRWFDDGLIRLCFVVVPQILHIHAVAFRPLNFYRRRYA